MSYFLNENLEKKKISFFFFFLCEFEINCIFLIFELIISIYEFIFMKVAKLSGVDICYQAFGNPEDLPIILIAGLGSQMLAFPEDFCYQIVSKKLYVIRFDNRDVGLSKKFGDFGIPDFNQIGLSMMKGELPKVPYTLYDMVDDISNLLEFLKIEKVHLFGASMGGMIAQAFAFRHPNKILTLNIMMTTTGNPTLPPGKTEILMQFFAPIPSERQAYIDENVRRDQLLFGSFQFDEVIDRDYRTQEYDRCYYAEGPIRQLAALSIPGNIEPYLPQIKVPTLIIHGTEDPFYPIEIPKIISNLIPNSHLKIFEGMGHSFPKEILSEIINLIEWNTKRV